MRSSPVAGRRNWRWTATCQNNSRGGKKDRSLGERRQKDVVQGRLCDFLLIKRPNQKTCKPGKKKGRKAERDTEEFLRAPPQNGGLVVREVSQIFVAEDFWDVCWIKVRFQCVRLCLESRRLPNKNNQLSFVTRSPTGGLACYFWVMNCAELLHCILGRIKIFQTKSENGWNTDTLTLTCLSQRQLVFF